MRTKWAYILFQLVHVHKDKSKMDHKIVNKSHMHRILYYYWSHGQAGKKAYHRSYLKCEKHCRGGDANYSFFSFQKSSRFTTVCCIFSCINEATSYFSCCLTLWFWHVDGWWWLVRMGFSPEIICSPARNPVPLLWSGPKSRSLVHTRGLRLRSNQVKQTAQGGETLQSSVQSD